MNFLSVEASSNNISFCFYYREKILGQENRLMKFGASKLVSNIEKKLKKSSLSISDFDAFILGLGPGSFTGLRISCSIIKAFALATGKPIIGVGSFFSCAYSVRNRHEKIAVVSDARKNQVYSACFRCAHNRVIRTNRERLAALEDVVSKKRDHMFVTYEDHIREKIFSCGAKLVYPENVYPKAADLLILAREHYEKKVFLSLEKLEPLYLHPKTCQIRK
ncbi:MAG: tRNA (adenosine(37)-N6)-threonylcarbamoyltransferase complex dimerization subunit type 1 TsaB [Candidatus Omnitrophica bacterium]|nr:tRNA (adenosine(37)-N6)-threonylcarbamoyltransferase complex dimerization subunit type 1 TsaB [Candidatus Omnitrophota bacterium]MDD5429584.1 tRNA (adenosine(37)-N6)-threonylcarbamoyltransferase complex dimerization subunit type 1 TsaB [Candidatus Omnitrophota bacterium]